MQDEQMKRIKRRAKPAAKNICPDETADAYGQAGACIHANDRSKKTLRCVKRKFDD
jgi:hypothetical protein